MDWKLELIAVPVSDIDRAKDFYVKIGFNADHDYTVSDEIRFVQLTPPGSACSIVLDLNFSEMAPGSVKGLQCVVKDAAAAREFLLSVGVEASDARRAAVGARSCSSATPTATPGRCSSCRSGRRALRPEAAPAYSQAQQVARAPRWSWGRPVQPSRPA